MKFTTLLKINPKKNNEQCNRYILLTSRRNHILFTWDFKEAKYRQKEFHGSAGIPKRYHTELPAFTTRW